jgi:hypothetical protein
MNRNPLRADLLSHWILGVFDISDPPRACRASLHTSRLHPLSDAVITEIALFGYMVYRMEKSHSIRTSHNAITTSDAPFPVHEDHSVCGLIGGAHRAYLDAGRFFTLVAELGHKEGFIDALDKNIFGLSQSQIDLPRCESVPGFLGGIRKYFPVFGGHVPFNPSSRDIRLEGDFIFELTGLDTESAPDAPIGIHQKYPANGPQRSISGGGSEDLLPTFHPHQGGGSFQG